MRRSARENAVPALLALAGAGTLAWLGLYGFAWNDYDNEARPAVEALIQGHVLSFLQLAPAYGGSLVERAPFALLPSLWDGGSLAVYRSLAAPCLLAAVVLAIWLASLMCADGHGRLARGIAIALCAANPIALLALEVGHPEELLGACLCTMAVLIAARGKPLAAGALVGLAIANKYWAVLAVPPVLLALDSRQRVRCATVAAASCGAVLAPLLLAGGGAFTTRAGEAASAPVSSIFQPWQLWWFAGHHGALVHGLFGAAKPGYRIGPAWVARVSHPAVVLPPDAARSAAGTRPGDAPALPAR
jgi:phosphatidylinositol alpha-1,6-mannosyltransferase